MMLCLVIKLYSLRILHRSGFSITNIAHFNIRQEFLLSFILVLPLESQFSVTAFAEENDSIPDKSAKRYFFMEVESFFHPVLNFFGIKQILIIPTIFQFVNCHVSRNGSQSLQTFFELEQHIKFYKN